MVAQIRIKGSKTIFILCILVLMYFGFLLLNSEVFKFDFVLIGVLQEVLTLPIMFGQLLLVIFSIKNFIESKYSYKTYPIWSLLILLVVNIFIWGSFIID